MLSGKSECWYNFLMQREWRYCCRTMPSQKKSRLVEQESTTFLSAEIFRLILNPTRTSLFLKLSRASDITLSRSTTMIVSDGVLVTCIYRVLRLCTDAHLENAQKLRQINRRCASQKNTRFMRQKLLLSHGRLCA